MKKTDFTERDICTKYITPSLKELLLGSNENK